jgi:hypothetical protein
MATTRVKLGFIGAIELKNDLATPFTMGFLSGLVAGGHSEGA